jgi:hypothetical protein
VTNRRHRSPARCCGSAAIRLSKWTLVALLPVLSAMPAPARAEEKPAFEVHQWGVWMADPAVETANLRDQYTSALPVGVETLRPHKLKNAKPGPSPLNLMTFYGQPAGAIEIDLRIVAGSFVGSWPAAELKNNRLRWADYRLSAKSDEKASFSTMPAEHWFTRAREGEALFVEKGARSERFLAYDCELRLPAPLKLEAGPDVYQLRSTSSYTLQDVVVVAPTPTGKRIGWLDVLPAAYPKKPNAVATAEPSTSPAAVQPAAGQLQVAVGQVVVVALGGGQVTTQQLQAGSAQPAASSTPAAQPGPPTPVTMSEPLASDGGSWAALSSRVLAERLAKAGLAAGEVELLLSLYGPAIFDSDSLTVACRLSPGAVDELTPLAVEPEPAKTVRVTLVITRNLDPKIATELQTFVDQLGSPRYAEREAAEKRLSELGSLAFPVLKQALGHSDPEIAFRAERLLLEQQQTIELPAAAGKF